MNTNIVNGMTSEKTPKTLSTPAVQGTRCSKERKGDDEVASCTSMRFHWPDVASRRNPSNINGLLFPLNRWRACSNACSVED